MIFFFKVVAVLIVLTVLWAALGAMLEYHDRYGFCNRS